MDTVKQLGNGYTAHECDGVWHVQHNGYTVMMVEMDSTRQMRDDFSGKKAFRFVTSTRAVVEVRLGSGRTFVELAPYHLGKAPVASLKQLVRDYAGGSMWQAARVALQDQCRAAGAEEIAVMNCFDANDDRHLLQLAALLRNTQKAATQV